MNWLIYVPPALSIYLLLISGLSSSYVKSRIHDFVFNKPNLSNNELVIQHIALDWSARLSFFNSMFLAIVTVFTIWSRAKDYGYAVATFLLLLVTFIPMMWWIMKHGPDELPATKFSAVNMTHASFCRVVLIGVNLVLILALALSERASNTPASSHP